jgi:release factor glutamine methyltransferase
MKKTLLSDITTRISSISTSPALEASVLIGHVIKKPRTWVLAHPEHTLTDQQNEQLNDSLTRLEHGESFPYVLGHWEFFGLDFKVTPDVLIPRPETELLVEKAITWLSNNPEQRNIADVGTGSGAIAVSLAVNISDAKILATDISSKALQVATQNAEKHNVVNKIEFIECDLLPNNFSVDLICANLPYIPTETLHKLPVFGREPTLALDGGQDGFKLISRLMQAAPQHLTPKALLLFEIEETLGRQAIDIAKQNFPNATIRLHKDLSGRDRLLEIQTQ